MLNWSRTDAFDRIRKLVSIQDVSPLVLEEVDYQKIDYDTSQLKFAIDLLTEEELALLFFRFFHGDSYKTLKKTASLGSKKTASSRVKKIVVALRSYLEYTKDHVYDKDLTEIEIILGSDGRMVADLLFRRWSKTKILKTSGATMSRKRLYKIISTLENICKINKSLNGFWKVIESRQSSPKKKD
jgi:hypothetical protein